jgi:hypothetical protein
LERLLVPEYGLMGASRGDVGAEKSITSSGTSSSIGGGGSARLGDRRRWATVLSWLTGDGELNPGRRLLGVDAGFEGVELVLVLGVRSMSEYAPAGLASVGYDPRARGVMSRLSGGVGARSALSSVSCRPLSWVLSDSLPLRSRDPAARGEPKSSRRAGGDGREGDATRRRADMELGDAGRVGVPARRMCSWSSMPSVLKRPPPPRPRHPGWAPGEQGKMSSSRTVLGVLGFWKAIHASWLRHGWDARSPAEEKGAAAFASSLSAQRERERRRVLLLAWAAWAAAAASARRMWSGSGGSCGGGVRPRCSSLAALRDALELFLRRKRPMVPGGWDGCRETMRTKEELVWERERMGWDGQEHTEAKI